MKNNILIIFFIITVTLLSCNKNNEVINSQEELQEIEGESFKYSEIVTIFSYDSLSIAQVKLSSNCRELFDYTKESLILETDECKFEGGKIVHTEYSSNNSQKEGFPDEIIIDILTVDTDKEIIGFTLRKKFENLKATSLPWKNTFTYKVVEDEWPYNYARFDYVSSSENGIFVEMGYLNCWLFCAWQYPNSSMYHLYRLEDNGNIISNPKNNVDEVYKLSVRITTNLNEHVNYYYFVSKSPY